MHLLLKEQIKRSNKIFRKLVVGWAIGLILASLLLSNVFEAHIYAISSLFIDLYYLQYQQS